MKHLTYLLLLALLTLSLPSCTDSDDIDISYKAGINISAEHLFDSFIQIGNNEDFTMDESHKLCLTALIYDSEGNLVLEDSLESKDITSRLSFNPTLPNGNYKLISIASFKAAEAYWEITDKDNIKHLRISNTLKYQGVFATLGLTETNFEVKDASISLDVEVKPVTSLIGLFYWNDKLGSTKSEYTAIAQYVEKTLIRVDDHKNVISFDNSGFVFSSFSQGILYTINQNYPLSDMKSGKSPRSYTYIAFLPTNGLNFYPTLKFTKTGQNVLGVDESHDYPRSKSIDIVSGKQYIIDFLLEAQSIFFEEYSGDELHEDRLNRHIREYNEQINENNRKLFETAVNYNFHNLIGKSKEQIEDYLNFELKSSTEDSDIYNAAADMIGQRVIIRYSDSSKKIAKSLTVDCKGCFSDNNWTMDSFHQFLEKKYVYQESISNKNLRYYYEKAELKDSKFTVSLNNTHERLIFSTTEL